MESTDTTMNPETTIRDLIKNRYKTLPSNLDVIVSYLDTIPSEIDDNDKRSSVNFRTVFVSVYMILYQLLRVKERDARKNNIPISKISRLEVVEIFNSCKSATIKGAVALFCLPKQIKRNDRFKIVASFLTNTKVNNDSIHDICNNIKNISETYKNVRIKWKSPDAYTDETVVNEYVRFCRALLLISDYTSDKALAQFAKIINKYAYYINVEHFKCKLSTFNITMFEPLITAYIKFCVAPIDANKEHQRLIQQFQVNPVNVIDFILDHLPTNECFIKSPGEHHDGKPQNDKNLSIDGNKDNNKPVNVITENLIQHYKPDRIYNVYIGNANYQQYLELTNVATPQSIYHVAMVQHCLYDVFEVRDISVKSPQNKSVMDLPWQQRLNLVNWRAKIALKEMTGEELINYKNTTGKSQALTISCINDDGLSTTQTIIIKPFDKIYSKKRQSTTPIKNEDSILAKQLKIEPTTDL